MRLSLVLFVFIVYHCFCMEGELGKDDPWPTLTETVPGSPTDVTEINPKNAQRNQLMMWGVFWVTSATVLFSLVSYGAIDLEALADPNGSVRDKVVFFIIAVPSAFVLCTLGTYVFCYVLKGIKNRRLVLLLIAVSGLLIFAFLSYIRHQRAHMQTDDATEDGGVLAQATKSSSYTRWLWNKIKLPYTVLLDGLLYVIYYCIWLLFGLTCLQWMQRNYWPIGYLVFMTALLYSYYYLSFYF